MQSGCTRRLGRGGGSPLDRQGASSPPWADGHEELVRRLEAAAAERGVSPEQVAVEAIEASLPARQQLSFIGIGHSGGTESAAERHREIIREQFDGKTAADI